MNFTDLSPSPQPSPVKGEGAAKGNGQHQSKRAFDLVAAGLLLSLVSPLMAAIAVALPLDSAGPTFLVQRPAAPAPERPPRHHRALAGHGQGQPVLRRVGPARPRIHRHLVIHARSEDPPSHPLGRAPFRRPAHGGDPLRLALATTYPEP